MFVSNLQNPQSGRPVENQFAITMDYGSKIFQSYESIICKITPDGEILVNKNAWLSRTTKKYLAVFLGLNNAQLNILLTNVKTF